MKFTFSWLKEFLDTDHSLESICNIVTSLGLEVESVVNQSEIFAPFIVGYIEKAEKLIFKSTIELAVVSSKGKITKLPDELLSLI